MTLRRLLSLSPAGIAAALLLAALPLRAQDPGDWDLTRARGSTRQIDFTTDEGTWMSMDLSPDGKWVVFDMVGEIFRVPATGGEAESLTRNAGISINYHPRYSPDGKLIAFVSDRRGQENLWVMDADGANPRPIFLDDDYRAAEPAWSPDGKFIYITRRGKSPYGFYRTLDAIWKYPVEGGPGTEVVRLPASGSSVPARAGVWGGDDRAQGPAPTPDGRYLYFTSSLFAGDDRRLRRLDLQTRRIEDITEPKVRYFSCCGRIAYPLRLGEVAPQVSPDGRYLTFARKIPAGKTAFRETEYVGRTALWLRDLTTGDERAIMDPITNDAADLHPAWTVRALPGYAWARDGKSIVITQGGKIRRLWVADGRVETIPFRAHVQRTISEEARSSVQLRDDSLTVKVPRWPASSPNGKELVFEAVGQLWAMSLPGGKPRPLTGPSPAAFEMTPSWSPDGRWIAYTTWNDTTKGALWRIAAMGGQPQRVSTEPGTYLYPSWAPDGSSILVNRWPFAQSRAQGQPSLGAGLDDDAWELVRYPLAAGGAPQVLSRVAGVVRRPGPQGRIFLTRWTSAGGLLVSFDDRGENVKEHLTVSPSAAEILPSPDGRWVAIQDHTDIFVAPFRGDWSGASPAKLDLKSPDVRRLTVGGAIYPHWRNGGTLEYFVANRYYAYAAAAGRTDSTTVRLRLPLDLGRGSIALAGARIITVQDGKVIESGTVVVKDGRIACVGTCDTSGVSRVVDVRGKTIMPGFVDVHAHHLNFSDDAVLPQHFDRSARYLAFGVTTVHDPSANDNSSFTMGELIDAGRVVGPRTYSTGYAITCGAWSIITPIDSYADAKAIVDRFADEGAVSLKDYKQCTRTQREWLSDAARRRGITLTSEGSDLYYLIGLVMDGHTGWEHPIQPAPIYSDVARFFGQAHTHYSPQHIISDYPTGNVIEYWYGRSDLLADPKLTKWVPWMELASRRSFVKKPLSEYILPMLAQGTADIRRAGGYVAIGAHGEMPGQDTHWELWSYAQAATPMEALEAATMGSAHFLGVDKEVGSISAGKVADLVVLNSNPLENIYNSTDIRYVMKAGKLYDDTTLDEIWPRPRPYGPHPWMVPDAVRADVRPDDYWNTHAAATEAAAGASHSRH